MEKKIKLLAFFLAFALVLIECYLIASSALDSINTNNELQSYCGQKCDYNPDSLMWEFSSDTITKGFTTRNECFGYCSKVKEGYAASLLNSVLNIFKK